MVFKPRLAFIVVLCHSRGGELRINDRWWHTGGPKLKDKSSVVEISALFTQEADHLAVLMEPAV